MFNNIFEKIFKNKNRHIKIAIVVGLIVSSVAISVGFASFSRSLNVNGFASVNKNSWRVVFRDLSDAVLTGTAEEVVHPSIDSKETSIGTYNVNFFTSGDSVTYYFQVANLGTFNAKLSSINIDNPTCHGNGDNAVNDAMNVCNHLSYELTYWDGEEINTDDVINKGDYRSLKLSLVYEDDIGVDELPNDDVSISNLSIELNYVQTDLTGFYEHSTEEGRIPGSSQNSNSVEGGGPVLLQMANEKISTHILNLYNRAPKTVVDANSVFDTGLSYNYASSVGLMNDRLGDSSVSINGGNVRYYGADPSNYIYFNCSDYNNQSDLTCEKWRIVGVFDNKIKIVRDSIGSYPWNNVNINMWTEYKHNTYDYNGASLMRLLNPGYDSYSVGGSLYWNATSGTCYIGSNSTESCNFTGTGLKNNVTRNMISDETMIFYGPTTNEIGADPLYRAERESNYGSLFSAGSGNVPRQESWTGKVSLLYPSDIMYGTDLSSCNLAFYSWNSACINNDWLYDKTSYGTSYVWLLTPSNSSGVNAWQITTATPVVASNNISNAAIVRPTVYLNDNILRAGGVGTKIDPYRLGV